MNHKQIVIVLLFLSAHGVFCADTIPKQWKNWLRDVAIIMAGVEKEAFKQLKTEEDRLAFLEQFWRARDPDPSTPRNEYREEFERRMAYVGKKYRGVSTDQGRIYVLMGKPNEITHYSGHQDLVESELWQYRNHGKPGLPPFINILFYQPGDTGDMQLYTPGLNSALHLLSPTYSLQNGITSQAYQIVSSISGELADASLSMVPGESRSDSSFSIGSTGTVLSNIYTLPEKEAALEYINGFKGLKGTVKLSTSTQEIYCKPHISIFHSEDGWFLNYALLPDRLSLKEDRNGKWSAEILLTLRVESMDGTLIHQEEKQSILSFDSQQASRIEARKLLLREFTPLIPGHFQVTLAIHNQTSKEFFTHHQEVLVLEEEPLLMTGFRVVSLNKGVYTPYSLPGTMLITDPRQIFSPSDTLYGFVWSKQPSQVVLVPKGLDGQEVSIVTEIVGPEFISFSLPLKEIKDGTYHVVVTDGNGKQTKQPVHLLPANITIFRPLAREQSVGNGATQRFNLVLAQQYLRNGQLDLALERFSQVPQLERSKSVIQQMAWIYSEKGNHETVLDLLSPDSVEKNYPNLLMLVASAIQLKRYPEVRTYLEQLRQYDDSSALNRRLGAVCLILGEKEKAAVYFKHAKTLEDSKGP